MFSTQQVLDGTAAVAANCDVHSTLDVSAKCTASVCTIYDTSYTLCSLFANLGSITLLAFVGTVVAAACVAATMWLLGLAHISTPISLFDASLFGAIICADDTVSVLAVFGRLKADKNLTALVFGESVFNDAVAIVLYNVVSHFRSAAMASSGSGVTFVGVVGAIGSFLAIFASSLAIGAAAALAAALTLRTGYFTSEHAPLETALVVIFAYCSFYLANGLQCAPACASLRRMVVLTAWRRGEHSAVYAARARRAMECQNVSK